MAPPLRGWMDGWMDGWKPEGTPKPPDPIVPLTFAIIMHVNLANVIADKPIRKDLDAPHWSRQKIADSLSYEARRTDSDSSTFNLWTGDIMLVRNVPMDRADDVLDYCISNNAKIVTAIAAFRNGNVQAFVEVNMMLAHYINGAH